MKFARELRLAAALAMSVGAGCFAATTANATTYNLNIDHCTNTCGPANTILGQVLVVQNGANVDFTVTALAGAVFNLNGAGLDTFLFGFSGTALTAASFTGLPTGFAPVIGAGQQDGFGTFLYGVNANGGTFAGPLTFTILNESLANLVASTGNGTSVLFAADLLGSNGNTGLVGGNDICTVNCGTGGGNAGGTPIPGALPLFGSVLGGGFFFSKWRKKRRAA
jgi:hypothetical protein